MMSAGPIGALYQREPRPIEHERLPVLDNNVVAIMRQTWDCSIF
jgi:hypothetical protein